MTTTYHRTLAVFAVGLLLGAGLSQTLLVAPAASADSLPPIVPTPAGAGPFYQVGARALMSDVFDLDTDGFNHRTGFVANLSHDVCTFELQKSPVVSSNPYAPNLAPSFLAGCNDEAQALVNAGWAKWQ
jgi:hypothetical protein